MKHVALILALVLPGAALAQSEAPIDGKTETGFLAVDAKVAYEWMLYTSDEKTRAITSNYASPLLTKDVCLKLAKGFMSVPQDRIAHCMNAETGEFINVEKESNQ